MNSQQSIHEAFLWVRQVYDEARTFLRDAQKMADSVGYLCWEETIYTGYGQVLTEGGFPFVYVAYLVMSPASTIDEDGPGKAAVLAIDFHSPGREGPYLLAGSVAYTEPKIGPFAISEGLRLRGKSRFFQPVAAPEGIHVQRLAGSPKGFAGIEEFRHVEIPLTTIDSPDKLRRIVEATIAFVEGDEQALVNVRTEFIAATRATEAEKVAP